VRRQCEGSAVQCSAVQVQVQRQCQCQCLCQCRGSTVQCSAEAVQRQVAQAVHRQCTGAAQAVHRQCRVSPGRGRAEAGQRPTSLPYVLAIADWSAHRDGPVLGRSRSCPPVLGSDRQRETHNSTPSNFGTAILPPLAHSFHTHALRPPAYKAYKRHDMSEELLTSQHRIEAGTH
jgi:hypothetical protein